jgi:hypothetical protein
MVNNIVVEMKLYANINEVGKTLYFCDSYMYNIYVDSFIFSCYINLRIIVGDIE